MVEILGFMQLIIITMVLLYEFKRKSVAIFLWITLWIMFGLMHFLTTLTNNSVYSEATINTCSLFVILFSALYMITRIVFKSGDSFRKEKIQVNNRKDKNISNILFLGLIIDVSIYFFLIVHVSGGVDNISKDNVYRAMANMSMIYGLLTYFYYLCSSVILYFEITKQWKKVLACAILIITRSLLSSSRMDMIILVVSIIIYYIIQNNETKKLLKNVVVLGVFGIIILYLIYALRCFRYYYGFSGIHNIQFGEFNQRILNFIINDDGELGLRNVYYYFVENNNNFKGFNECATYLRIFLLPLPSSVTFGLKPADFCLTMGKAWKPDFNGIISFSVTPTLFGDCYGNLGFLGFILGSLWGIIINLIEKLIKRKNIVLRYTLICLCATELVDIGRGSVYNPLCILWYCGILLAGCYCIVKRIILVYSKDGVVKLKKA